MNPKKMQNNSSNQVKYNARLRQQIKDNLKSFKPVVRSGWAIKFSIHNESNVVLIFTSLYTGQTIVRYFTEEIKAVDYINMMLMKDASVEHEL
jgi:hypothetical protein